MSEQPQGPGWWLASDGRWYPPDQAPPVPPPETWATPPPGPPPRSGMSTGAIVALSLGALVVVLALVVGAAALIGSEDETSSSSAVDVPAGFAVINGDGVSIAAPEGWEDVDADDLTGGSQALQEAFPDASPELLEQGIAAIEQGAVLVAFDVTASEFAANVNVIDAPGEVPLAEAGGYAAEQLDALGGEVLESGRVDLPAGDAVRVAYRIPVATPDGSSTMVDGVQHYVPTGGRTYIVTITAASDQADQMMETFRVA